MTFSPQCDLLQIGQTLCGWAKLRILCTSLDGITCAVTPTTSETGERDFQNAKVIFRGSEISFISECEEARITGGRS